MPDKKSEKQEELVVNPLDDAMSDLVRQQKKLVLMEAELKQRCDEHDVKGKDLLAREDSLIKREKDFEKKHGSLSDSERFGEMVRLIDQVYTLYVSSHSSDKGLYDSIKLLLDARERYNTKFD